MAETSYAYTASHTGALMRLAQMAEALGAALGPLAAVPAAVARVLDAPAANVDPPERLLELIGAGPNAWTAQEGALKIREASYVATEGLSAEQFLHGKPNGHRAAIPNSILRIFDQFAQETHTVLE